MGIIETTLLFLGSIIGAGFATGAEIITFFGNINLPIWYIAIIIGTTLFLVIILEIILFHKNASTIKTTTRKTTKVVKFLDIVFVMIYLILFTTMTAGVSQITNTTTCIISLLLSSYITIFGIKSLSRFNIYITTTIIVLIISITLPNTLSNQLPTTEFQLDQLPKTTFWAMLYAGLNCFIFPDLISSKTSQNKFSLIIAGFITSVIITILAILILSTIQATNTQSTPIPLLAVSPTPITIIVILLAILTSQYTSLFAITQRLQKIIPTSKNSPLLIITSVCILAFIGSFWGFNHIINLGYPIIGAITCFYLLFSFLQKFWSFLRIQSH